MFTRKFHGIVLAVVGLVVLLVCHKASHSQSPTVKCTNTDHCLLEECLLVIDGGDNFYLCCVAEPGKFNACAESATGPCAIVTNTTTCDTCFKGAGAVCPSSPCNKNGKVGKKNINLCLMQK
jgi:hypothetical protein